MNLLLVWEEGTSSAGSTALRNLSDAFISESESEPYFGKWFSFVYNILLVYCISISIYLGLCDRLSFDPSARGARTRSREVVILTNRQTAPNFPFRCFDRQEVWGPSGRGLLVYVSHICITYNPMHIALWTVAPVSNGL